MTMTWPEGTNLHKTQDVCAWPDKTDKEWLCAAAFPAPAGIRPLYVTGRGLVQPTWFATGYGLTPEAAEEAAFQKYNEIINCNHDIERIAHVDLPDPQPKVYLLDGDAVCNKCHLYMPFQFMDNRLFASMNLATRGHNDQKRKYTGDPYIVHPRQVYNKTAFWKPKRLEEDRIIMGCAAWMHDLLEDCQISDGELMMAGGPEAFQLVRWLTNPSKGVKKPRAYRKAMDRDHILQAPQAAKVIKIIDRNCNLNDLKECPDLDFLALYAGESRLLWENIKDADEKLAAELLSSIEMVERRSHGDSQG